MYNFSAISPIYVTRPLSMDSYVYHRLPTYVIRYFVEGLIVILEQPWTKSIRCPIRNILGAWHLRHVKAWDYGRSYWFQQLQLLGWNLWFVTLPSSYTRWRPRHRQTCPGMDTWNHGLWDVGVMGFRNSYVTLLYKAYRVYFNPNTHCISTKYEMAISRRSWVQLSDGLEVNWKPT